MSLTQIPPQDEWLARHRQARAFEAAWQAGPPPILETFLPDPGPDRLALLVELVHTDLEYRRRRGEAITVEAYLARFPDLAAASEAVRGLREAEAELAAAVTPGRAEPAGPTAVASRLGKYTLQEEVGRGGFGVVYRAWDPDLQRTVAIKVLRRDPAAPRGQPERFLREARSAAQLRHPHIAAVLDVGEHDGTSYLVSAFIAGPPLAARLTGEPWPCAAAVELIAALADALHHAHQHGVIHRDVKPGNVLLDADGRPHLVDFGLAQWEAGATLTETGMVLGTPAYVSPEQARGEGGRVDARADVYSLGAVFYELLTGSPPFRGNARMVLRQLEAEEPRPPGRLNDQVPRDLETVCLKCLAKEPPRRYPTAQALADDLRRWQRGESVRARPVGPLGRAALWARRRPAVAALVAGLVAVTLAGAGGIAWEWYQAEVQRQQAEDERDAALRQQARAEKEFRRAREAVDAFLTKVADHPDLKAHAFEPLRRDLLRTAQGFYERFVAEYPDDPNLAAELGRAHGRLGEISMILDSKPRSLEHFERKRAVFARLHADHPDDPDAANELADSHRRLGQACEAMGRYAEAEAAYGRARTLWDDLAGKWPDQPDYVERRLAIRTHLGFLGYVSHRPAEADRILSEGLALSREWAARLPVEPRHQSRLAYLHRCHALVRAALGQPDRQEESFRAAVALFEDLVGRQPEEVEYLAGLGVTLNDLGIMHAQANHPEPAQAAWARARTVLETLARNHPANGDYQNAVANLSNNLGALLFAALHRPEEAMAVLLQTRPVAERLVHDFPQVAEYRYHRGNLHLNLSLTYLDLGRYAEARALADQVIGLLEEERGRPAQEASSRALLGEWYGRRAFALAHLERHDEGQRDLDRALAVCPEGQRAHFRTFRDLLTAARRLAEGDYFQAAAQAHTVAGQAADDPALTVWAAELLRGSLAAAQHAPDLPADQRAALADQYGRWAVEALDRARAAGYFTVGRRAAALAHGPAWEGLRGRPDFQRLAGAVGASPAPP